MKATYSQTQLTDAEVIEKLVKMKNLNKTNDLAHIDKKEALAKAQESVEKKQEMMHDSSVSLKELKETAIVLRQKLDTLESEKNVMEVEYSQVVYVILLLMYNYECNPSLF